jgi:gamma-glutamylcyclotransferase (GGCT)/AIG2-like uncharacterized protein YtfP
MVHDLLFVYGTLLTDANLYGRYLSANSVLMGDANFNGRLFDLGEYPGAIYDPLAAEKVYGRIYKLKDPAAALALLDDYEGINQSNPAFSEYKREMASVNAAAGIKYCWIYLYNRTINGLIQIDSGRWVK